MGYGKDLGTRLLRGTVLCGVIGLIGLIGLTGCGEEPVPSVPVRSAGQPAVRASGEDAGAADARSDQIAGAKPGTRAKQLTGIRFDVPTAWDEQPESDFYEAKYMIASDEGEMMLTLTTMGGGIEANLERWVGQFQLDSGDRPRRDTLSVDGEKSQWLDVRGTFRSQVGDRPGPHQDWRLLGVAIPMSRRPFLLKLVGPRAAVSSFEAEFRSFVRSGQLDK